MNRTRCRCRPETRGAKCRRPGRMCSGATPDGEPVRPAEVVHRQPRIGLPQEPHDLRFRRSSDPVARPNSKPKRYSESGGRQSRWRNEAGRRSAMSGRFLATSLISVGTGDLARLVGSAEGRLSWQSSRRRSHGGTGLAYPFHGTARRSARVGREVKRGS